jgi:UDP-N-acetylmuramoylalanine--D-glutamate ligase
MILIPNVAGKTFGVVGLGKSGRATVGSLLASGANIVGWDDGEEARVVAQREFPTMTITAVKSWKYSSMRALVMSPGIMLNHPAVLLAQEHHVEVLGDIELLYRARPRARYLTITGTNGKSTTTTLTAHILKACGKQVEAGGNLGVPALDLGALDANGLYVLELSSYQLDLVRTTAFQTAMLLNISPDHLDHHGSMENYIAAKRHIFDRATKDSVAIIGVDDTITLGICQEMMKAGNQRVIPISARNSLVRGIYVVDGILHNSLETTPLTADLRPMRTLQGEHNWQNAAAAYAACWANGCAHHDIVRAMRTYPGLAHRMQWLGTVDGVQFVNDSKATNADAAEKALKTFDNIYWILGGREKEGGITSLEQYFPKVRNAYLIGEAAHSFQKTLEGKVKYLQCNMLSRAFEVAAEDAMRDRLPNAVVLLSPACASFDQFANFELRGEVFAKLFKELQSTGGGRASTA